MDQLGARHGATRFRGLNASDFLYVIVTDMKPMLSEPVWRSLGHAVMTLLYILAIALFLSNTKTLFEGVQEPNILIPVGMLLLFVVSATVTGALVLGQPILMYLDGKKREAVHFLGYTIGWLALMTVIVFIALGMSAMR